MVLILKFLIMIGRGVIQSFISLLVLFGTSISGFAYLLSFLFKTPSGAQVVVVFIVFVTGTAIYTFL